MIKFSQQPCWIVAKIQISLISCIVKWFYETELQAIYLYLIRFSTTHLTLIYKLEIAIRIFSNPFSILQNVFGLGYKPVRSKNSKSNHGLQVFEVYYKNHRWHCIILFTGISKLTANFLLHNSSNLYNIKVHTSYGTIYIFLVC